MFFNLHELQTKKVWNSCQKHVVNLWFVKWLASKLKICQD